MIPNPYQPSVARVVQALREKDALDAQHADLPRVPAGEDVLTAMLFSAWTDLALERRDFHVWKVRLLEAVHAEYAKAPAPRIARAADRLERALDEYWRRQSALFDQLADGWQLRREDLEAAVAKRAAAGAGR